MKSIDTNINLLVPAYSVIICMFTTVVEAFVSINIALFSPKIMTITGKSDGTTIGREASLYT